MSLAVSSIFSWWCCSCQVEGDWFWKYEANQSIRGIRMLPIKNCYPNLGSDNHGG
nr:MAG TPA: hypothetical protein [Caudoviricetes sp.]